MTTKNIYKASGWFSPAQEELMEEQLSKLEANPTVGVVYSPLDNQSPETFGTLEWKTETYNADVVAIQNSDIVVGALTDDADSGTIWEIGYAIGIGKPVVLFTNSEKTNLMLAQSIQLFIPKNKSLVNHAVDLETIDFNHMPTNLWIGEVE